MDERSKFAGHGGRSKRRRAAFAGFTLLLATGLGLTSAELVLHRWPALLGFERLSYLPEPLKLRLGARFVHAYRRTAQPYFARRAPRPGLQNTVPDARYGIRLGGPGEEQAATPQWPVTIDRNGFRNPTVPARADVLFVGDSFTAGLSGGVALPAEVLFATRTGRLLSRRAYQAACYGWGPRQFRLAVEDMAPRLHPRWVIVATYLENDLGDVWVYDGWKASPFETYAEFRMYRGLELRSNPRRGGLDTHSMLVNLVRFALERNAPRPVPLPHQPTPDADRYRTLPLVEMAEVPDWSGPLPPGWRLVGERTGLSLRAGMGAGKDAQEFTVKWRTEDTRTSARQFMQLPWWPPYAEALEATVQAARDAGARPLIVLIPTLERVLAPAAAAADWPTDWPLRAGRVPDGPARAVASLAEATGADFLDLAPALRAAVAAGQFPYRPNDIHFNAAGHAIAAEAIAARLRTADTEAEPDGPAPG